MQLNFDSISAAAQKAAAKIFDEVSGKKRPTSHAGSRADHRRPPLRHAGDEPHHQYQPDRQARL